MALPAQLPPPEPQNNPRYTLREIVEVCDRLKLTPRHLLMLQEIKNLSTKHGYCYASQRHLARRVGLERRQTQTLLSQLTEAGYIKSVQKKGKTLMLFVRVDFSPMDRRQIVAVEKVAQSTAPPVEKVARSTAPGWRGGPRHPVARSSAPHKGKSIKEEAPTLFTDDGPRRFDPWRSLYGTDARTIEARLAWAVNHSIATHLRLNGNGPARSVVSAKHTNGAALLQLADPDEQLSIPASQLSRHWFGQWVTGGEEKANASSK